MTAALLRVRKQLAKGAMQIQQLGTPLTLLLLTLFFGVTFLITLSIGRKQENADHYMTAGNKVAFGISAASMTATWIWASSLYASATSGYIYGISGPIHYGLWGALMILFIYPFGRRIRSLAPNAHTLAEILHVRHGRSSQLLLAGSNVLGSLLSLTSNFIAGGALIAMLSPLSFSAGVLVIATGVLLYTLWSGIRASILTDFVQVCAMLGAAAIIVPTVFFTAGGPEIFTTGAVNLTPEQQNFFSSEAFLNQGAPYIAAVLAYAIGNQTIAQRLFAVREDKIKQTFITATVGYGATVIGVGMLGVLALYLGIEPLDGDVNNLIPQLAASYLGTAMLCVFFVMIIGAMASTADSDLSALSSIMMTDFYGRNIAKPGRADPKLMLLVGRCTMITATGIAVYIASNRLNILDLLVLVGAIWGALVFPVIASFYWSRVTNKAFSIAVVAALAVFFPVRFGLIELVGPIALFSDLLSVVGVGVIAGLMVFGFLGLKASLIAGSLVTLAVLPFGMGFLHLYPVLTASLLAYSISTLLCVGISLLGDQHFDFEVIAQQTGRFDRAAKQE
ncbi:sodium:solute symporter family protein [Xinfangfangia sp. CPCC 101601]|uniref:Sodium:solute symporter family protein n=1 Tax=Pseudogemmobacter lacusdianii TaxID=3069608 RepID=A0ABU0W002_9RHOB|nr:sodium:solute symporter family protein [Xinfangfangia sp. CPCC 101601]MDQ2067223.1 sodium:solute symporter family protein [Xinfangfangia sp. CPCC 101601]